MSKSTKTQRQLEQEIIALEKALQLENNALEWQLEFPELCNDKAVFNGFDVIVGNPPYGKLKATDSEDLFLSFISRCYSITNYNAYISLIVPSSWITSVRYIDYRKEYLSKYQFLKLINLPFNVFESCYVDTSILTVKKEITESDFIIDVFAFDKKFELDKPIDFNLPFHHIKKSDIETDRNYKILFNPFLYEINKRFSTITDFAKLGDISFSTIGLLLSKYDISETEKTNYYPLFLGNVNRYSCEISEKKYVDMCKHKPEYLDYYFHTPKIWIRRIVNRQNRIMCTIPEENMIVKKDIYSFTITSESFDNKYVLAVLNSKLISFIYLSNSTISTKDDFRQTTLSELRDLPIPKIPLNEQNVFIQLTDKILQNNKENVNNQELEKKLDNLIYKLFQLSESEIITIENARI